MTRAILLAVLLPGVAWGQATPVFRDTARMTPARGISISPTGPLGTTTSLYIEDNPSEPTPFNGSFFTAVGQGIGNEPRGRPVFEVGRWGGIGIWDYLLIGGGGGAALHHDTAAPGNGAMLGIGTDLGPNGINLTMWSNVFQPDFMEMAIADGGTYDASTKRFRFTNSGSLVFGSKVATVPALKPSGTHLQVRLGDDSNSGPLDCGQLTVLGQFQMGATGSETALIYASGVANFSGSFIGNGDVHDTYNGTTSIGGHPPSDGSAVAVEIYAGLDLTSPLDKIAIFSKNHDSSRKEVIAVGAFGDLQTNSNSFLDDSGTTGNRTVNLPNGRNAFAAGASTITITNSLVTTASRVFVVIQTNDATAILKNVVPASGNFAVNLTATATGITKFGWWVVN